MGKRSVKILEAPEAQNVGALVIFSLFAFYFLVAWLTVAFQGMDKYLYVLSWVDIGFHLLCLGVSIGLMKDFLSFAWLSVSALKKDILKHGGIVVGILVVYCLWMQLAYLNTWFYGIGFSAQMTLPLMSHALFLSNNAIVTINPIFGTLCAVVVAPVTTSCIFYATAFAKGYNIRPWLGYLLVSLLLFFPRFVLLQSGWWEVAPEFWIYIVQLPMHLLCCWLYQKVDNIWAPIFVLSSANLLACVLYFIQYYIG